MAEAIYKAFWTSNARRSKTRLLPNGPIKDILRHVPKSVPLTLSEHQIAVLNEALARRRRHKNHAIDYSASINWFGKRYYLSFVAGPEARALPHGKHKLSARRLIIKVGYIAGLYIMAATVIGTLALVLYFVKSIAGLDLFEGPSFLHGVFF